MSHDIFSINHTFGSGETHCPSDDCWNYDTATQQCQLKPEASQCMHIQCGSKEMSVVFSKDLFGEKEVKPTPQDYDDDQYILQCGIGTCGIHHFVQNKKYEHNHYTIIPPLAYDPGGII